MEKLTTSKRIWSVFLTLAMVFTMSMTALPAYAAGEGDAAPSQEVTGTGTASVLYRPVAEGKLASSEFTLVKVGHFKHDAEGKSHLELDTGIPPYVVIDDKQEAIDLEIDKKDYADDAGNVDESETGAWVGAWQNVAAKVNTAIEGKTLPTWTATASAKTNGIATFTGLPDGLYLVKGVRQRYADAATEVVTYYTPVPSLIMVLNGRGSFGGADYFTIKQDEESVKEYVLKKVWAAPKGYEDVMEALKPASVDIVLTGVDSAHPDAEPEVVTVTLNKDNNWTYEWKSDPNVGWNWKENLDEESQNHFVPTSTDEYISTDPAKPEIKDKRYITITNTYTKTKLKLTKQLDQFLKNGDNGATFVYEIKGYRQDSEGKEKEVFTKTAGINFKDGAGTLSTIVDNIPATLNKLTVQEIYKGNYSLVGEDEPVTAVFSREDNMYVVSFENEFKNDTTIKGGIVNTYTRKDGKIVLTDRDYGKTPQPLGPAQ